MKAIDEERKLRAEIATLNRRIGQLRRHDNIWEGFRGAEIAKAEWERDNKVAFLNRYVTPKANEDRRFWAEFWAN